MHMLSDLERGPILEMVLTKLVRSRRDEEGQTTRAPDVDHLQVVVISTEETQDEAFSKFLSTSDGSGQYRAPLFLHADQRPVTVSHYVVLPGRESESYTRHRFAECGTNGARSLSKETLRVIDKELDAIWVTLDVPGLLRRAARDRRQDVRAHAIDLIADLFQERSQGCRILVFVPGRSSAEELAKQFRNRLSELARSGTLPDVDPRTLQSIKPLLDESEDSVLSDTLRMCAAEGVFVHHADVYKRVRQALEIGWGRPPGAYRTEVIFATETLSYGVNLGINDVVILGTKFRSQTRMREPKEVALSVCAFHNMTGRAGRLGYVSTSPGVYVVVATDEKPTALVRKYYSGVVPAESRLFVSDDKQAQLKVDRDRFAHRGGDSSNGPCDKYSTLGPLDFSYPFVRSALDALRHLNLETAPQGSTTIRTPVSKSRLLQFFNDSAYAHHILDANARTDSNEALLFDCALDRILDGCSSSPLHLVQASAGQTKLYAITDRGEAIIDTGTELSTVEPLLRLVTAVRALWPSSSAMPVEVFLLCLSPGGMPCRC